MIIIFGSGSEGADKSSLEWIKLGQNSLSSTDSQIVESYRKKHMMFPGGQSWLAFMEGMLRSKGDWFDSQIM